jgi:predicted ATP-grasp superfamily ATP-dependent carboligase
MYIDGMRKGEELKAPRHASAAASCDDHVTIYDIIPNTGNSSFVVAIYI